MGTGPGRPGIAPERLLRALLLQCFYSVRSERQLTERLEFDLLFRRIVGTTRFGTRALNSKNRVGPEPPASPSSST